MNAQELLNHLIAIKDLGVDLANLDVRAVGYRYDQLGQCEEVDAYPNQVNVVGYELTMT